MWIGIFIAIFVTVVFYSLNKNRNASFQGSENNNDYSGGGYDYSSNDYSDNDGADSGSDGGGD